MKKNIMLCLACACNLMAPPMEEFRETDVAKQHRKAKETIVKRAERDAKEDERLKPNRQQERDQRYTDEQRYKKTSIRPTVAKGQPVHIEIAPHQPDFSREGRTAFEDALKDGDIEKAKKLWEQSRDSNVTTEEFVSHLKERYSSSSKLKELYPEKSYDDARNAFESDLQKISSHIYKIFRDSFVIENRYAPRPKARTDQEYFTWIEQNPRRLTNPDSSHEETPLETSVRENSPEMAEKLIEIAKKYKIRPIELVEPFINEYKKIRRNKGADAANDYVAKAYPILGERLSAVLYEHISRIR